MSLPILSRNHSHINASSIGKIHPIFYMFTYHEEDGTSAWIQRHSACIVYKQIPHTWAFDVTKGFVLVLSHFSGSILHFSIFALLYFYIFGFLFLWPQKYIFFHGNTMFTIEIQFLPQKYRFYHRNVVFVTQLYFFLLIEHASLFSRSLSFPSIVFVNLSLFIQITRFLKHIQ